jgi:hypothetical protein
MCFEFHDKKIGSSTPLPRHLVGTDVQRWRKEENEKRRCLEGIMTGTKEEGVRYLPRVQI